MQTARGYELGAVDYILSPIVPQILRSKVRVFVDLFRAQRRAQSLVRAEADRAAAEDASRRSEFISRASRELTASLDLERGIEKLAQMLVPTFAEYAYVCVTGADAESLLGRSNATPAAERIADHSFPPRVQRALEAAQREGRRVELRLHGEPPDQWPAQLAFARVLPMTAGDRTIGVVLLVASAYPASSSDDSMLTELVSRAAIAFDNAELYSNLKREMARSKEVEGKLQEANRRKDEFLAMLSHELRNPLAPIRGAAEVIRKVAPSDPRVSWARDVVERQVGHLAQLVDDLLDVSRITQGKITLQSEPLELAKVVFHSIETARPLLEAKRQKLAVNVDPAPIWLRGDFARLAQVFGNLLHNAVKYTPDSGSLEVNVSAEQGYARFSVSDDGIGIDPQLLPHVFELFTQGDRTLDRSQGGLGVGLTVVERLVALHHGRVEVSSAGVGKGSEFRVTLPCISEVRDSDDAQPPVLRNVPQSAGRRVLVVDDNADAAETVAVFMRLEGHEVRTASDGPQALSVYQIFAPEVAIVDIGLPGMNGYEVARRLREDGSKALLIALTGYGQSEDLARSKDAGFHYHFIKPADVSQIQSVIVGYDYDRDASGARDRVEA
jgi:signal transduction histidine kinase/ActR/RegA family two-component response regulator